MGHSPPRTCACVGAGAGAKADVGADVNGFIFASICACA